MYGLTWRLTDKSSNKSHITKADTTTMMTHEKANKSLAITKFYIT